MTFINTDILFAVMGATGGGAVGALVQVFFSRRKNQAEAAHLEARAEGVIVNAAMQVADRLQVQLAELEERTTILAGKNKEVRDELTLVHEQNIKMAKQIAHLEKENKSLKTSYNKLKAENDKLKTKLDKYNKDSK